MNQKENQKPFAVVGPHPQQSHRSQQQPTGREACQHVEKTAHSNAIRTTTPPGRSTNVKNVVPAVQPAEQVDAVRIEQDGERVEAAIQNSVAVRKINQIIQQIPQAVVIPAKKNSGTATRTSATPIAQGATIAGHATQAANRPITTAVKIRCEVNPAAIMANASADKSGLETVPRYVAYSRSGRSPRQRTPAAGDRRPSPARSKPSPPATPSSRGPTNGPTPGAGHRRNAAGSPTGTQPRILRDN